MVQHQNGDLLHVQALFAAFHAGPQALAQRIQRRMVDAGWGRFRGQIFHRVFALGFDPFTDHHFGIAVVIRGIHTVQALSLIHIYGQPGSIRHHPEIRD